MRRTQESLKIFAYLGNLMSKYYWSNIIPHYADGLIGCGFPAVNGLVQRCQRADCIDG